MTDLTGTYEQMLAEAGMVKTGAEDPERELSPAEKRDAIHRAKALEMLDVLMSEGEFERTDTEYETALAWANAYNKAAIEGNGDDFLGQHKAAIRNALAMAGIFAFEPKGEPLTGDALERAGQRVFRDDIRHERS